MTINGSPTVIRR